MKVFTFFLMHVMLPIGMWIAFIDCPVLLTGNPLLSLNTRRFLKLIKHLIEEDFMASISVTEQKFPDRNRVRGLILNPLSVQYPPPLSTLFTQKIWWILQQQNYEKW